MPPTATNKGSPIAIPAIEPATPLREFNKDIVIGISAPPTLIVKLTPNNPEIKVKRIINKLRSNCLTTIKTASPAINKLLRTFIDACPLYIIDLPNINLASLPEATKLPVKVTVPITIAKIEVITLK